MTSEVIARPPCPGTLGAKTPMASQLAHKRYLFVTAFLVGCFGPVFFLGTMEATMEPARWSLDLLAWPLDGTPSYASPDTRFLSALTGGFLFGWGVMIAALTARLYDKDPEAVRRSVVTGLVAWFMLDSAGSITSGNPSNALWNVLVLLTLVGPLWFPARQAPAVTTARGPR